MSTQKPPPIDLDLRRERHAFAQGQARKDAQRWLGTAIKHIKSATDKLERVSQKLDEEQEDVRYLLSQATQEIVQIAFNCHLDTAVEIAAEARNAEGCLYLIDVMKGDKEP